MNQQSLRRALTQFTLPCPPKQQIRWMGSGSRGARGHGWLHKYREGLGGRHLQGRYHNRDIKKLTSINDQVFALNTTHAQKLSTPSQAYLDIAVEGEEGGPHRVVIELASAALPNTCRNFVDLCEAEDGGYKSSKVFKILPQMGLCLGDNTKMNDGRQGRCSPNVVKPDEPHSHNFPHEATVISHAEEGIVTMISTGLDKNDSRFLILTAADASHLDGKYVAFGKVKEGLNALQDIVQNTFTKMGKPSVNIQVVGCGVL
jgi:cyclophilin family peptidyl-prolyl cis-trans isomerase